MTAGKILNGKIIIKTSGGKGIDIKIIVCDPTTGVRPGQI